MEQDFVVVEGMDTVSEALNQLRQKKVRFLLVAKRSDDDEYGMVTVGDVARKVLAQNRSADRTNVYEIMSKPVLAVLPGMDIRYCARLFNRFSISAAPVLEGDRILGIVTYDQLVLKGLAVEV